MLRVVEGGRDRPLLLDELPLGPWAGSRLEVWATKTGSRWHADPECSTLNNRARSESWQQPDKGVLGDRRLPPSLHCGPAGPLGEYIRAAEWLVRFTAETRHGETQFSAGVLPLEVLPGRIGWRLNRACRSCLESGELSDVWSSELADRLRLIEAMRAGLAPAGERVAVMTMANWVRQGRTPFEHQPRYDRFVDIATEVFDAHDLDVGGGTGSYVNHDALPDWLDLIAAGHSTAAATRTLVDRESQRVGRQPSADEVAQEIPALWRAIGTRWRDVLTGSALAHPGAVFAVFHLYGTILDHDLMDVCLAYGPAAQLTAGHLDWVAAVVPAAFRLHLTEEVRGRGGVSGLVLLDEGTEAFDSDRCALFLRNLVANLGYPELGQHVSARGGQPNLIDDTRERFIDIDLPDDLHRFAISGHGRAVTIADCLPALQAARHDEVIDRAPSRKARRR